MEVFFFLKYNHLAARKRWRILMLQALKKTFIPSAGEHKREQPNVSLESSMWKSWKPGRRSSCPLLGVGELTFKPPVRHSLKSQCKKATPGGLKRGRASTVS